MVDSCMACDQCRKGEEQLCWDGNTAAYNGKDRFTCEPTYGGYSKHLVVREEFGLSVPKASTSPGRLLSSARASRRVAAQDLERGPESKSGSLASADGHMAVKLAAGLGCGRDGDEPHKEQGGRRARARADRMLVSSDAAAMTTARSRST